MTEPTPARQQLNGHVMRDYEQLIAALAASRISQNLTYAEMAQRVGRCYLQQVFNWLNGAAECRARRLFALANALGYDLALIPRKDADVPHAWQEYNPHGNTCQHPGCTLTEDEHPREGA